MGFSLMAQKIQEANRGRIHHLRYIFILKQYTLYTILIHLQQSLLKNIPLIRTVGRNVVGSTVLIHCSLCM